jgi:hypothetical protein
MQPEQPARRAPRALVALLALAGACGGGASPDAGDGGDGGAAPVVQILEPGPGATVSASAGMVSVSVVVLNFTLASSSSCPPTASACGQVRINVDGNDCNATGLPYAAQGAMTDFTVDLNHCLSGLFNNSMHTFTASLIDATGAAVPGASSSVSATVQTL